MTTPRAKPISKRDFLNGMACGTAAFFDREHTRAAIDAGLQWKFYEGNQLGELAREILGPGIMLPLFGDEAIRASEYSLEAHTDRLYEVTISAGGLLARADALLPVEDGWELVEVKSGKEPEKGSPKPEYIDDAAFTLLVARLAGVRVTRVRLMLISRAFVHGSAAPMFASMDITEAASARAAQFSQQAPALVALLSSETLPQPVLSMTCRDCEHFATRCIGVGIADSILRIPRINEKKLSELHPHQRISTLPSKINLTETQKLVVDLVKSSSVSLDRKILAKLHEVRWPAHYLDFEAVMPAIPWFDGDGAYTAIPHQYSIHTRTAPGTAPSHAEYLAPVEGDWRRELVERLIEHLDGDGSIVVYSSYEKTRLNALAESFPGFASELQSIVNRLFDLEPFFKTGYVHHQFAGSSSIKKVLPVLVPDLSYSELAVGNGTVAAGLYSLMRVGVVSSDQYEARRRELLEYCALDTMAMVRLHDALLREASN